jgi:hypothetical protein
MRAVIDHPSEVAPEGVDFRLAEAGQVRFDHPRSRRQQARQLRSRMRVMAPVS